MPTACRDLLSDLPNNWREVDVLLDAASREQWNPISEMYDALCRASVVLVVSHLEGFVRECARAVIEDINNYSSFAATPSRLKKTFCKSFVNPDSSLDHMLVGKLMDLLDGLDTKMTPEPFLFGGTNDDNRNPSPAVIERVAKQFGISGFFLLLASSNLDDVFTNSSRATRTLTNNLRQHVLSGVNSFPYNVDPSAFALDAHSQPTPGSRTLWETFLDDLLKRRHDIAHGSNRLNGTSVLELRGMKEKVVVLQYGFALVLSHNAVS